MSAHDAQRPDGFNVAAGLRIQRTQLQDWKLLLNERTMNAVKAEAKRRNDLLEGGDLAGFSGHDVWRGNQITEFIVNLLHLRSSRESGPHHQPFQLA